MLKAKCLKTLTPTSHTKMSADTGRLGFFGAQGHLACPEAFSAFLAAMRRIEWVVYSKRPLSGPAAVLAYLARYTHRVAIANSRLIACDADGVSFRWKDDRAQGRQRSKVMRLSVDEFRAGPGNLDSGISGVS